MWHILATRGWGLALESRQSRTWNDTWRDSLDVGRTRREEIVLVKRPSLAARSKVKFTTGVRYASPWRKDRDDVHVHWTIFELRSYQNATAKRAELLRSSDSQKQKRVNHYRAQARPIQIIRGSPQGGLLLQSIDVLKLCRSYLTASRARRKCSFLEFYHRLRVK